MQNRKLGPYLVDKHWIVISLTRAARRQPCASCFVPLQRLDYIGQLVSQIPRAPERALSQSAMLSDFVIVTGVRAARCFGGAFGVHSPRSIEARVCLIFFAACVAGCGCGKAQGTAVHPMHLFRQHCCVGLVVAAPSGGVVTPAPEHASAAHPGPLVGQRTQFSHLGLSHFSC
jgi:hypothetical protein